MTALPFLFASGFASPQSPDISKLHDGWRMISATSIGFNWKYLSYHDPQRNLNIPFVPDRNARRLEARLPEFNGLGYYSQSLCRHGPSLTRYQPCCPDCLLRCEQPP